MGITEISAIIGSVGQFLTACASIVLAVIAGHAAKKFNQGQVIKYRVEHINQFNLELLALARHDRQAAERVGQKVMPQSDIVEDYMHFLRLNAAHMEWSFRKAGYGDASNVDGALRTAAAALKPHGEAYVKAILGRGYEPRFAAAIVKSMKSIPGQDAGMPQVLPIA
jgi:hypothetical protein